MPFIGVVTSFLSVDPGPILCLSYILRFKVANSPKEGPNSIENKGHQRVPGRWWVQIFCILTPICEEMMIQFDEHIFFRWVELKPPTIVIESVFLPGKNRPNKKVPGNGTGKKTSP